MTRRFFSLFAFALASLLATRCSLYADPTNTAPDFKEVYDLLRTNLPGATDENLNRAAVEGLLAQLHGKAMLVSGGVEEATTNELLSKATILESNVVYLRTSCVVNGLADKLNTAYRALAASNKVIGVVLDLRFADGDDSASVPETAKLFTTQKISNPIGGPLVVLVNGETRGAAEALAEALQKSGVALIIGSAMAGKEKTFQEFSLKNGEWLRIATVPPNSSGGPAVTANGIQPDIAVAVNADDERAFLENPYGTPAQDNISSKAASNSFLLFIDHTSEADLVLQKQHDGKTIGTSGFHSRDMDLPGVGPSRKPGGGGDDDFSAPLRAAEPQKPVIRDPVLARAMDLIKSLALVRKSRP